MNDRVKYVGFEESLDFLCAVDAVLLPSEKEGGPIALLEAWDMKVPFFMRHTGIAEEYPDAVFSILSTPKETADSIVKVLRNIKSPEVQKKLDRGFMILENQFSIEIQGKFWKEMLINEIKKKENGIIQNFFIPMPYQTNPERKDEVPYNIADFQINRAGKSIQIECYLHTNCVSYYKLEGHNANSFEKLSFGYEFFILRRKKAEKDYFGNKPTIILLSSKYYELRSDQILEFQLEKDMDQENTNSIQFSISIPPFSKMKLFGIQGRKRSN